MRDRRTTARAAVAGARQGGIWADKPACEGGRKRPRQETHTSGAGFRIAQVQPKLQGPLELRCPGVVCHTGRCASAGGVFHKIFSAALVYPVWSKLGDILLRKLVVALYGIVAYDLDIPELSGQVLRPTSGVQNLNESTTSKTMQWYCSKAWKISRESR